MDRVADDRDRREEAGDHLRAPEAHLAPGQDIAHERGRHDQQEDHHAEQPHHLARRLVRPVIEPAEDVDIDHREEHRRAVGVRIAQEPAGIDVAHDRAVDRIERVGRRRMEMHRQHDAGDDLDRQRRAREHAEVPPVIEVARHRIARADGVIRHPRQRQLLVQPAHQRLLGLILPGPGETHFSLPPQPTVTEVGDVNL